MKNLGIPIDPNKVFDDMMFDPCLAIFERQEREATVRALGYTGQISVSDLYQGKFLEIYLDCKTLSACR